MPKQPSVKKLNEQIAAWRSEAQRWKSQCVIEQQTVTNLNKDNAQLRDVIKQNDRQIARLHNEMNEQFNVINIYREICGLKPNERPLW